MLPKKFRVQGNETFPELSGDAGGSAENSQSVGNPKGSDDHIESNGDGLRSGSSTNAGGSDGISGNFVRSETHAQDGGSGKIRDSESGEGGGGSMDAKGSYENFDDGGPVGNVQGSAENVDFTGDRLCSGSNGESQYLFFYC